MTVGVVQLPGALEGMPRAASGGLGRGPGGDTGAGPGIGPGKGPRIGPGPGGYGVSNPQPIYSPRPNYTADAMRAKVSGAISLEAVVLPDGSVGEVRITRSLDSTFG